MFLHDELPASVQLSKYDQPFRQPIGIKTALYERAVIRTYLPRQPRMAPVRDRGLKFVEKKAEKLYTLLASARRSALTWFGGCQPGESGEYPLTCT